MSTSWRKVLVVVVGVFSFIVIIIGLAGIHRMMINRGFVSVPVFDQASCNIPRGASSATYSATVVATQNYDQTVGSVQSLITKYNGDLVSLSEYDQQYPLDNVGTHFTSIKTTSLSATLPIADAQNFMSDLKNTVSAPNLVESPSYSETTYVQMFQSCLDAENARDQAEAFGEQYQMVLPALVRSSVESSTDLINAMSSFTGQLQNFYGQANNDNDNVVNASQYAGLVSVTISINAAEIPTPVSEPIKMSSQ